MKWFKPFKVLDRFRGLFEKFGVDYDVMRKILVLKFLMDSRRTPSIAANQGSAAKAKTGNRFLKSLWMYGLMGIILVPLIIIGDNLIFQMSSVMGIIMFMVMTSLISDFSSVLLDLRDRTIILTRPVEGKTLTAAKTLHVLGYMIMITGALTAPSIIAGFIRHGLLFGMVYLWMIVWMDLLIVVLTALLYLSILNFYDGDKLRDMVNYFQIALSIAMAVGYQFVGRMFQIVNIEVVFKPAWWQFLLPPVWYGAAFEVLFKGNREIAFVIMSVMALTVPLVALTFYAKNSMLFEQSLEKLEHRGAKGKSGSKLSLKFSRWIAQDPQESLFFRFFMNMMRNEREFKLKVYPSLGFSLIFPFIFLFNMLQADSWQSLTDSRAFLFIYFSALMLPTAIMMMSYASGYKGSWIYHATPIQDKTPLFKGALKALIFRLLAPVFLIECMIFVVIFGARILPDMVLAFSNAMLYSLFCFMIFKKRLPFSEPYETGQNPNSMSVIPMMLILAAIGGMHFYFGTFPFGIPIMFAVSLTLNIYLWRIGLKRHVMKIQPEVDLSYYEVNRDSGTAKIFTGSQLKNNGVLESLKWKNRL